MFGLGVQECREMAWIMDGIYWVGIRWALDGWYLLDGYLLDGALELDGEWVFALGSFLEPASGMHCVEFCGFLSGFLASKGVGLCWIGETCLAMNMNTYLIIIIRPWFPSEEYQVDEVSVSFSGILHRRALRDVFGNEMKT